MSGRMSIPVQHIDLLESILEKLGVSDFKKKSNNYSPDFTFSIDESFYWGYKSGLVVNFSGDDALNLKLINEQYEFVISQISKTQEKQD